MNTDALKNLNQFIGTESYYRQPHHWKLCYSDGVKFLCENADCWWLLDVIASYQPQLASHQDSRLHQLQFWKLKVNENRSATVTCVADGGEPPAVIQTIPWTDFPLPEVEIWVGADVLGMVAYLKSEH